MITTLRSNGFQSQVLVVVVVLAFGKQTGKGLVKRVRGIIGVEEKRSTEGLIVDTLVLD